MSLKSGILIFFGLAIVAGASVIGFFWLQSQNSENLTVRIEVPNQVTVGAPFEAVVKLENNSGTVLNDVKLSLEVPREMVFLGTAHERTFTEKPLGNIGAGELQEERVKLLVLEGGNTVQPIKATISYQPGTIGSRFEKEEAIDVPIGGSAILLDLVLPQKTFNGEEIGIEVSYENVSDASFSDAELTLEYPPSFAFVSASEEPNFDNRIWKLGTLRNGTKGKLSVKGVLSGPENSFYGFTVSLQANFFGRLYTISEKSANVAISLSPLSLALKINESFDYISKPGETLTYSLTYRNQTEVGLRDVIIRARVVGDMFEFPSLESRGFLRASDNTVIWTAANTPELALLAPSSTGKVEFSVKLKDGYPIRRISDKNFTLKVEAEIESPTVPPFVGARKTIGQAKIETKVRGTIETAAKGFFRDAPSGIVNRGPMPPVVGQTTQFTIHWIITNYATDVSNIELQSNLGGNVRFTGVAKSNTNTAPTYNERTQKVMWNLERIFATKGVLDEPLEAIFQVELTPGANQIGGTPVLVQRLTARATDDFTSQALTSEKNEIQTSLPDDITVTSGSVQPAN